MIDIETEDLMDLAEAAAHPALRNARTRKACHLSQLYRWIQRGARATNGDHVRLETVRTPSGLRTSREAIGRFVAALTNPDRPCASTLQTRRSKVAAAERELAEAGFDVH